MYIDKNKLLKAIEDKLVVCQKHPEADLWIYNYTQTVQYEKIWNEITIKTRGLILDGDYNVVSRVFPKFWNLGEHKPEDIPNLSFECFNKLDGSLGILYFLNEVPYIASRGSFNSEQALHATNILHTKYKAILGNLKKGKTYLFEIIYPDNRICVDYGDLDDIILLTIIDNETGEETIEDIGFPIVERYDGINDISELLLMDDTNREGFVVRFSNGFRVKVKFDEYVRLHRIITGVSNLVIWKNLKENKPFDEILERVPDEFYEWVKKTKEELITNFKEIEVEAKLNYKVFSTRKETAEYFLTQPNSWLLFNLLDGRDYSEGIWKLVRPKFQKPFKVENQNGCIR